MLMCLSTVPESYGNMSLLSFDIYWNISYSDGYEVIVPANSTLTSPIGASTNLTYRFVSLGFVSISCHSQARINLELSDVASENLKLNVIGKPHVKLSDALNFVTFLSSTCEPGHRPSIGRYHTC